MFLDLNDGKTRNALTDALLEELRYHYKQQPDSRTIVFVRTRELTRELKTFLLTHEDMAALNPQQLTS